VGFHRGFSIEGGRSWPVEEGVAEEGKRI
jgi:hypothetical protein